MTGTLTYLTLDPIAEGVGTSQVARYVRALATAGLRVELHSFERTPPPTGLDMWLRDAGVIWTAHAFGRLGPVGGIGRVLRGARALRKASVVHARSDLAATAASLRAESWLWDMRAFFADQRVASGTLRAGSPEHRTLRRLEGRCAREATAIVVLADAAIAVLTERHGAAVARKCRVITTCVDLDAFGPTPMPAPDPLRFLLAGTINAYYDVPAMAALVAACRARRSTALHVHIPGASFWDEDLAAISDHRSAATPAEMPAIMQAAHVGLSVCRADAGVSLRGAMPTKLGELLAVGRPVVVNAGLGDMDRIIAEHRCGVVLGGVEEDDVGRALDELDELLADPETPGRCRQAAETHFSLSRGVAALLEVYASLGVS